MPPNPNVPCPSNITLWTSSLPTSEDDISSDYFIQLREAIQREQERRTASPYYNISSSNYINNTLPILPTSGESIDNDAYLKLKDAINTCRSIGWTNDFNEGDIVETSDIGELRTNINDLEDDCLCYCDYCPCNCNYCPCNCNYCPCNCNYCTCACNYSCTCNCNYYCTCRCNYWM